MPYGRAHFKGIRQESALYIDKTRFIRQLEKHRYVFFVRPRRFGKSCWISLLESYYGRHEADAFFNNALETLERNFESYCRIMFEGALAWHPDLFPQEVARRLCAEPTINDKLVALFDHCRRHGIPLYILIDEYDNVANTILAERDAENALYNTDMVLFHLNHFGLLGIQGASGGVASLGVPNQTVRQLLYGHLRGACDDAGAFQPDILAFQRLTRRMAQHRAARTWRPCRSRRGFRQCGTGM